MTNYVKTKSPSFSKKSISVTMTGEAWISLIAKTMHMEQTPLEALRADEALVFLLGTCHYHCAKNSTIANSIMETISLINKRKQAHGS